MLDSVCPRPAAIRASGCEALNVCVATGLALYSAASKAHWNVSGSYFGELHALFGKLVEASADWNDVLAERVAALGGLAVGTPEEVAALSRLRSSSPEVTAGLALAASLADHLSTYVALIYETSDRADTLGLIADVNALGAVAEAAEKLGWQLRRHCA